MLSSFLFKFLLLNCSRIVKFSFELATTPITTKKRKKKLSPKSISNNMIFFCLALSLLFTIVFSFVLCKIFVQNCWSDMRRRKLKICERMNDKWSLNWQKNWIESEKENKMLIRSLWIQWNHLSPHTHTHSWKKTTNKYIQIYTLW